MEKIDRKLITTDEYRLNSFLPHNVVKHSICHHVCPSVRPSHSWVMPKRSNILKNASTIRLRDVSRFWKPILQSLFIPTSVLKRAPSLSTAKIWPIIHHISDGARGKLVLFIRHTGFPLIPNLILNELDQCNGPYPVWTKTTPYFEHHA